MDFIRDISFPKTLAAQRSFSINAFLIRFTLYCIHRAEVHAKFTGFNFTSEHAVLGET